MGLGTYVPEKVSVVIAGHIVSGYADGSFVEVDYTNDRISMTKGADGETARVITSDDSGSVTIRLQQTSLSNDVLSALYEADIISHSGVFPLVVSDDNGNTKVFSDAAWIKKLPTTSFGTELEDREWVIDCANLVVFVGGSS